MTGPSAADLWAEQAAAEEWLAGDIDWPDRDPRRYMLRRGRWKPIDVLPDIADYRPAA